jgi:hypothetical protein
VTSGGGISCADQIDRVSDPERPLRAAQFLKPPALPGDTYLPDHKALAGLRRFFVLGPKARRYRFMEFASNLMWGTTRHKSRPCRTAKSGSSPSLSTGMPKGWDDTSPRLAIATPPLRPSAWQSRPRSAPPPVWLGVSRYATITGASSWPITSRTRSSSGAWPRALPSSASPRPMAAGRTLLPNLQGAGRLWPHLPDYR